METNMANGMVFGVIWPVCGVCEDSGSFEG